jgi:hypothetical protein
MTEEDYLELARKTAEAERRSWEEDEADMAALKKQRFAGMMKNEAVDVEVAKVISMLVSVEEHDDKKKNWRGELEVLTSLHWRDFHTYDEQAMLKLVLQTKIWGVLMERGEKKGWTEEETRKRYGLYFDMFSRTRRVEITIVNFYVSGRPQREAAKAWEAEVAERNARKAEAEAAQEEWIRTHPWMAFLCCVSVS